RPRRRLGERQPRARRHEHDPRENRRHADRCRAQGSGCAQHRAPRARDGGARRGRARARRRASGRVGRLTIAELLPHEQVRFAHNSERQFAKLLDFYAIEWDYEPRTFVLERDRDGNPAQAFTPDFFLPAYDLYIEITTLNQKLVTKKNRKARRL